MKYVTGLFALALFLGMVAACGGDDDDTTADATVTGIDASDVDASGDESDASDLDGSAVDASDHDGSGVLGFMDECDPDNDLCDSTQVPELFCYNYPNRGPHCTHVCSIDEECDEPSPGCNNNGVCRAP